MSILNRLKPDGHLDDRALAALQTDAWLSGERPAHPHLAQCATCRTRMAEFTGWFDELRDDAAAEADAVFTTERLNAQQAHILRRIEATERPARVIRFPRFAQPIASSGASARRWIASAAAAGLLVGVALGQFMDLRPSPRTIGPSTDSAQVQRPGGPAVQPVATSISDEELMSRLEEIVSPRIPDSLVAFDSMTPRARDYPR